MSKKEEPLTFTDWTKEVTKKVNTTGNVFKGIITVFQELIELIKGLGTQVEDNTRRITILENSLQNTLSLLAGKRDTKE